jgi:dienelactone hydrolase
MNIRYIIALIVPFCAQNTCASTWTKPNPDVATSYVYAPPVLSSEIFMSKYCPAFTASTGELITCNSGINVINLPASSGSLAEIHLKPKGKHIAKKRKEPFLVRVILAPVRALCQIGSFIAQKVFGMRVKKGKDPIKESLNSYWIEPTRVNLAQEEDLALFKDIYNKHLATVKKQTPHKKHAIVLYGTSRGSATVFNFSALNKLNEVQAVICDGLFDSIQHVYECTSSSSVRLMIKLLRKVSSFDDDGILPITVVDKIPIDVPLLLVTSRKDKTVPWQCTMNIYTQLRKRGHKKVHILILKKAPHAMVPRCNKQEKNLYQSVVHAFYKHYNLPHIPEYAQEGQEAFAATQPNY